MLGIVVALLFILSVFALIFWIFWMNSGKTYFMSRKGKYCKDCKYMFVEPHNYNPTCRLTCGHCYDSYGRVGCKWESKK